MVDLVKRTKAITWLMLAFVTAIGSYPDFDADISSPNASQKRIHQKLIVKIIMIYLTLVYNIFI